MAAPESSADSLLDFYQNAPCGFHSLDAEGRFLLINDTELNWLGYRRDEVVGRMKFADILTPESHHTFDATFLRFGPGCVRDVELTLVRKDGTLLEVLVSSIAVRDSDGNLRMTRSVAHDLSGRKRAETRFRDVLEAAPDAMLICNQQGEITLSNLQCEEIFGYRRDELQGRSLEMLLPERFRDRHATHIEKFFSHPQTRAMGIGLELTGRRKNGTEVPVEISLSPLQTEEGLHTLAAIRDVTARRCAGEQARKNEARYRLLFENSMDGILLTVPDGRIFDANPSACSILGRTREQIIAAGREGILDTSDPNLGRMLEERRIKGKIHCELTARHTDETVFPMEISSAIFRDAEGSEFTCIIFRDISLRKQAEAERERLIAELTDALSKVKVLSGLLSICSSCKRIRDEEGHWERMEVYIRDRSSADFSHGLCPDCLKNLYPDYVPR